MYRDKTVCVVVPAYNEEMLLDNTIRAVPGFVDHIVVVDDCSTDSTVEVVRKIASEDNRVLLVRHEKNLGVGAAVSTGYLWCRDHDIDIAVVMNGDNQMDPADMPALLDPLVENRADYTKGNRLVTGEAWQKIPHIRYLGNSVLPLMTKIARGYWHVTDSQSGYTAMNRRALHLLPLERIYRGYGMPNDLLVSLNIYNMAVMDIPVKPVYGVGEKSGMKIRKIVFTMSLLLVRSFFRRMIEKYVIRDFHPLIFFYMFGLILMLVDIPLVVRLFVQWAAVGTIPPINALAILFCTFTGMQSLLFAMLFDMEANKELKGREDSHTR